MEALTINLINPILLISILLWDDALSGVSTQVLDWNISESDGSTDSCTYQGDSYYWIYCEPGYIQACTIIMPFAVGSCDITIVSFETIKISFTNRTDGGYIDENGPATINKPSGSVFTMTPNDVVILANLDCGSGWYISNIKYQLKLYPGYLEYGLYCTQGDGGSSVHARLPSIHLNVIARV